MIFYLPINCKLTSLFYASTTIFCFKIAFYLFGKQKKGGAVIGFLLFLVYNDAMSQIILDTTSTNPTCTKSFGHVSSSVNNGSIYYNVANGSLGVIASGGVAPYSYVLNGQYIQQGALQYVNITQNNGYFPGLNSGSYNVVVTDANGAIASYSVKLTNTVPQPAITDMYILADPSTCTSSDGSLIIDGSGGTPPYTYSIDGGLSFSASNIFSNLRQGFYVGILKDANGCLVEYTSENNPHPLQDCGILGGISFLGATACADDATIEAEASHSQIPYHDTDPWNFSYDGVHYHSPNKGPSLDTTSGIGPGIHDIYIKDTATGQIAISAYNIVQSCYIYITFINVDASCQQSDGSVTVIAASGTPPYTYTIDGTHYQLSNQFVGLSSGNYSITVKDANGETSSAIANLYNKCPVVTATATDDTCDMKKGAIIARGIKGTQPYQFSIDDINFQASNVFTGLIAGNYKMTIKDANGFTDSTSVTVNNNCLQLSLTTTNTTCGNSNGSITATASNGTGPYQYSIDGLNFVPNTQFNNLVAETYTVTARDANGLLKDSTVTISDAPGPQASISTTPASCTNTGGSITINATGGTAPLSFSADNGNSFGTNNIFNNLDSGQYITVTKDANGCSFSDTIRLTALPTPRFYLGNDTSLCMGQSLLISAPDSPSYSYQWQDNSNGHTYLASANGLYSVKVTNAYGCSSSDTIKLALRPLPVFSLANDTTVCNGHAYTIGAKFNSPSNGFTYTWSDGTTGKPSLLVTAPGLYWLQSSDGGCAFRDSITVSYKPSPTLNLGNDTTLCDGQTLLLNASNNNSTYLWQDGSTSPSFSVSSPGTYSVKVDDNGCDTSGSITVRYIDKPIVNLVKDTLLCFTQLLTLDAGYPNSTYLWQDGSTQPFFKVSQEGTYSVQVADVCGTTFDSSHVSYENCACNFYVPNGFTPNGDGVNDVFQPKYQCLFSSYLLKIYNRWGQLVFASSRPDIGWDGNLGNQRQPTGTYVWELTYRDNLTGKDMRKSGTVVLVR